MTLLPPLGFEKTAIQIAANHSNSFLLHLSSQISTLGSTLTAVIILGGLWQLKKQQAFKQLGLGLILTNTAVLALKTVIARPRPEAVVQTFTHSMPSGHSAAAFLTASILSNHFPRLRGLFYTLAVLVGISRFYLRAHYPLDILTGAVLGLIMAELGKNYSDKLFRSLK